MRLALLNAPVNILSSVHSLKVLVRPVVAHSICCQVCSVWKTLKEYDEMKRASNRINGKGSWAQNLGKTGDPIKSGRVELRPNYNRSCQIPFLLILSKPTSILGKVSMDNTAWMDVTRAVSVRTIL